MAVDLSLPDQTIITNEALFFPNKIGFVTGVNIKML